MLLLKLSLVPLFLLMLSLAGKRWGPATAGWLAGLPVVAGPILFFVALEQGAAFAAVAAAATLSATLASVSFSLAYSHAAHRAPWPLALLAGLAAWGAAALSLSHLPGSPWWSLLVALLTLVLAPRLFPSDSPLPAARPMSALELVCRLLAGALLTLAVTWAAAGVGQAWSGLLAVFPVLGIVLAVFSHRSQGPRHASVLLGSMVTGLYSFVVFNFCLAQTLPRLGIGGAFLCSLGAALAVQFFTKHLRDRRASARVAIAAADQ